MNDNVPTSDPLGEFEGVSVLPEISKKLVSRKKPIPTVYDELDWLDKQKTNHQNLSNNFNNEGLVGGLAAGRAFGNKYTKSFFQLKETQARHFAKNLSLLRDNPSDRDLRNVFLYGARNHRFIPLLSMVPTSDAERHQGYRYMQVDPELKNGNVLDKVPFSINSFPIELGSTDENDQYSFKEGKITPENTRFFANASGVAKMVAPFYDLYNEPKSKAVGDLISIYNNLVDSDADKLDPDMGYSTMPLLKSHFQLARIESDEEKSKFSPRKTEVFHRPDFDSNPEGLTLDLSYTNLFSDTDELYEDGDEELAEKQQAYWKEKGVNNSSYFSVKEFLVSEIGRLRWEKMPDSDKTLMKQYLGALSEFYPDLIKVDADGLGVLSQEGKGTIMQSPSTGFDTGVLAALKQFSYSQYKLFGNEEPIDWNTDLVRGTENELAGEDYFQSNLNNLSSAIMNQMQRMMRGGGTKAPYPSKAGIPVDSKEFSDNMRHYDLEYWASSVADGMGMEGANPEETKMLVKIIAQYLELSNIASIHGEEFKSFKNRRGKTYMKDGKEHVYDMRRHLGDTVHRKTFTGAVGNVDPIYKLVTDFIKDAENYVVMQGKDGKKLTPLVEFLGLTTRDGEDLLLPNRVSTIRLAGTGVSKSRDLAELRKGIIFKSPLENWWIEGASSHPSEQRTTKVKDIGKSAKTILEKDTNPPTEKKLKKEDLSAEKRKQDRISLRRK